MTNQPNFKCVANLGDATPWDYGGAFVLMDQTGVYTPELHVFEEPRGKEYEEDILLLEKCTYINGVLSDNKYHPEHQAWFADSLSEVARTSGITRKTLILGFCSDSPLDRAWAYLALFRYNGPQEDPDTQSRETVLPKMKKWLREAAQYETA